MKLKSKYLLIFGITLLCPLHVTRGQSSNSTTGGLMSQFNSWISRLRGNNNSNNNNNNNNNSDKDKESDNKSPAQPQMRPVQYSMVPYPIMTGMPGMYSPMSPMTMPFAPRPMPSAAFAPAMPFGSLAAGSSLGPNLGPSMSMGSGLGSANGMGSPMASALTMGSPMSSGLGSSMGSPMSSGLGSSMGQSYSSLSQLSGMRPSSYSASQMMPVHHDYHDSSNDYQVGGYGVGNSFGNSGYSGLSSSNYGSLGSGHSDHQMGDSAYSGEQVDPNNEEYSSGYQR